MATTAPVRLLTLPVDAATLAVLHQAACVLCGAARGPLRPAGHVYTLARGGARLGRPVVACPDHNLDARSDA